MTTYKNEVPEKNNQEIIPSPNHVIPVTHTSNNFVKQEKNVVHANGCTIIFNKNASNYGIFDPTSLYMESPTPDFSLYENRLETFKDKNWTIDFITPSQMASAGLYFFGKKNIVSCYFCSREFGSWQYGDDPMADHKLQSPECNFFKMERNQGYDVCGLYMSPDINNDAHKIEHFFKSIGVVHKIGSPKNKEYTSFDARLKSFDKCEIDLIPDIHALSEAGLFYIGNGQNDQVRCFYCSVSLISWEEDDEPWTEHAKWSPLCSYVLLQKGKHFVDDACRKRNEVTEINKEEISELISDDKDDISEESIERTHEKRQLDLLELTENNQIKTSLSEVNLRPSQEDTNIIPDSVLCIICRDEELKVACIPCGHVTCIQCAMKLDHCGVCRSQFGKAMRVYIYLNQQKGNDINQVTGSSSQCSDEPSDPISCNACNEKEMDAVFLPCRHIYACVKCATELNDCPVCSEPICATMLVYL